MPGRKTSRFAALLLGVAMASSITAFAAEMPRETLDADHAVVSTQAAGETGDTLQIQPRALTNNYNLSDIPGSGEWVKLNSSAMDLSKGARLDISGTWSPSWVKMDIKLENRQNGTYSVWYGMVAPVGAIMTCTLMLRVTMISMCAQMMRRSMVVR